jgi:hypothetical protein
MSPTGAEWKPRIAFAEIAETLRVDTADVLAVWSSGDHGAVACMFTNERTNPDGHVLVASLLRDSDDILRCIGIIEETEHSVDDLFRMTSQEGENV